MIYLKFFIQSVRLPILIIVTICFFSCSTPERPDIVFDDFETGDFDKWNKQGTAFQLPRLIDSIKKPIKNYRGKYIAYSDYEGSDLNWDQGFNQGKLVSKPFTINRKYIDFLIAGGKHETRECVSLFINNEVVKFATGENDFEFRKVSWDVGEYIGESAIIEIVDALSSGEVPMDRILVDNIVFTDNTHQRELVYEDFESGTYNNWTVEGDAFAIPRNRTNVYYPISAVGFTGNFFAFSFGDTHDVKQGKLISKPFVINHDFIKFVIGGGNHKGKTCINLVIDNAVVFSNEGQNDGQLRPHFWDLQAYKGEKAHIEIVDDFSGGWGHIMVDDIVFYDAPAFYTTLNFWGILLLIAFSLYFIIRFFTKNSDVKDVSPETSEKLEELKQLIKDSSIYRKHNASISDIVDLSELDKTEIESYFENSETKSWGHYLNILRVDDFKQQLKEPSNKSYTMVSIAEKCGFNSKTSFYRVFKSITNMTPSEYKKSLN